MENSIIKRVYILGFLFCAGFYASAQEMIKQRNSIAVNPFNIAFGTVQLQYEFGITSKLSVVLNGAWKTSSGIFAISGFKGGFLTTDDFNFKGYKIIPEFRWYLQNSGRFNSGFYIGSYYKFQDYHCKINGVFTDSDTQEKSLLDLDARIKTHQIGLEAGYKLPIKRHFYIDFLIAGPGYSINNITLIKNRPVLPTFYKEAAQEVRDKYSIVKGLISNSDFNESEDGKSSAVFRLPAFRYGVCVGYNF